MNIIYVQGRYFKFLEIENRFAVDNVMTYGLSLFEALTKHIYIKFFLMKIRF